LTQSKQLSRSRRSTLCGGRSRESILSEAISKSSRNESACILLSALNPSQVFLLPLLSPSKAFLRHCNQFHQQAFTMTGALIWTRENLIALYAAIDFYRSLRQSSICDEISATMRLQHWQAVVGYVESLTGFTFTVAQAKRRVNYDLKPQSKRNRARLYPDDVFQLGSEFVQAVETDPWLQREIASKVDELARESEPPPGAMFRRGSDGQFQLCDPDRCALASALLQSSSNASTASTSLTSVASQTTTTNGYPDVNPAQTEAGATTRAIKRKRAHRKCFKVSCLSILMYIRATTVLRVIRARLRLNQGQTHQRLRLLC